MVDNITGAMEHQWIDDNVTGTTKHELGEKTFTEAM